MPVEVIGIDHVYFAVRDLARSARFYDSVMHVLGYQRVESEIGGDPHVHYFNRQFGISLRPAHAGTPDHDSYAPGLHHFCFRVIDERTVDVAAAELRAAGVTVIGGPPVSGVRARLLRGVLRGSGRPAARDHELPCRPPPAHVPVARGGQTSSTLSGRGERPSTSQKPYSRASAAATSTSPLRRSTSGSAASAATARPTNSGDSEFERSR